MKYIKILILLFLLTALSPLSWGQVVVSIQGCTSEDVLGCTDNCATNYNPNANVDDNSCVFEQEPVLECWQTANFNTVSCLWEVTGTQPTEPIVECYEVAVFNATTCAWDITGNQPSEPTTACFENAVFNNVTCLWEIVDGQDPEPEVACYETAVFNDVTCSWDVTGTQPVEPNVECYETAIFNDASCVWDVSGNMPTEPLVQCYEITTFNNTSCQWDVSGTQPQEPTVECYESTSFNTTTCVWEISGTMPVEPELACYETAAFNDITCVWDVTGTPPIVDDGCEFTDDSFDAITCEVINTPNCENIEDFNEETCECDPCTDTFTILDELTTTGNIGFTGGTPPYTLSLYTDDVGCNVALTKIEVVDADGCACELYLVYLKTNGSYSCSPFFTDALSALDYAQNNTLTFQGSLSQGVAYFSLIVLPSSANHAISSECAEIPEPCPDLITEGFVNEINYEVLVTFTGTAAYPLTYEINQLTGCNSPLVSGTGTMTSVGTASLSVPTTACSNGTYEVTATDANGCTDIITFNVTTFEDNIQCVGFDVTEVTDFTTCMVTLTATGGTQPYDWSQVQIAFPNVTISGNTATFNQCEINGGVGSGVTDSNVLDANGCNKVVRVTYDTSAACCNINLTCDDCTNSCPAAVYEVDDYLGNAFHSTIGGNASGTGCVYYGFTTPYEVISGATYTHCATYTANSPEASLIQYKVMSDEPCMSYAVSVYDSSSCIAAGVVVTQPDGQFPARVEGLVVGQTYTFCYAATNTCATTVDVYETCLSVSEAQYCDSNVSLSSITVNSGDPITLPLGACTFDADGMTSPNMAGYAAYFYSTGGNTYASTFPTGLTAVDIGIDASIQLDDCNNTNEANGGGCNDITLAPIVNTSGQPITIGVGVVNLDVASTCSPPLYVIENCPIFTTTITVLPTI